MLLISLLCSVLGQDDAEQDVGKNDRAARAERQQNGQYANQIRSRAEVAGDATADATKHFVAGLAANARPAETDENERQNGEENDSCKNVCVLE